MDLSYPADSDAFRQRMNDFLDEHLPADWAGIGAIADEEERLQWQKQWREVLSEHQLLAPNWPSEYGGAGLTQLEHTILNEEFAKRGVPTMGSNDGFSISMVGNTILHWGTEEQKQHYIPRILDGTDVWCQGYSEPNSGSDLANLGCKADLDGDEWIVNGQKIWTSSGMHGNMIFTLCRTDPDVPKHKGISFLLVPMDQPGVEVRPIVNIAGKSHFCEVFFSDARCPKDNVLGGVNNGWAVANTLLGFERGVRATVLSLPFRAELDNFIELARSYGKLDDPAVRQQIARFHTTVEIMKWQGQQALTRRLKGATPGPGVVDQQAPVEHLSQGDHRGRHGPGRGRRHGRLRRRHRERARGSAHRHPQHGAELDGLVLHRPARHDLRRHLRGPEEHHR